MKKLLCLFTALVLSVSSLTLTLSAQGAALSTMPSEEEIIRIVGLLEVMNGDYYGDLHLDNKVTRAEFLKMALCASVDKDKVKNGSTTSPFPDVRASHWAASYVAAGVSKGYIKGYLDGTFKPDGEVTLEEAATIMLRVMGYTSLDSGKYPDAQLSKYRELNMDQRISAVQGQALTRRECMYLVYNALCAKNASGALYCTTLGCAADSNDRIDYLALVNDKMKGPVTVLDAGYSADFGFAPENGSVYRDNKKTTAAAISLYDVAYYNPEAKTVWCFSEKVLGVVNAVTVNGVSAKSEKYTGTPAANDTVILSGKSYKLAHSSAKSKFSAYGEFIPDDFVMLLLDRDGNVADAVKANAELYEKYADEDDDKVAFINSTLKGPYVIKDENWLTKLPFAPETAKYYLDGADVTVWDGCINDVFYYSEALSSVWIYRESATGVVTNIAPSRDAPTSVSLGSKNYTLSTSDARTLFSTYGRYDKDSLVTLLLGKDGSAVYAVDCDADEYARNIDTDDEDYVNFLNSTVKGPYVVKDADWTKKLPFAVEENTVYSGNTPVSPSFVMVNDVFYYSEAFRRVWILRDTATGIVSAINPSKDSPASVVVGGKSYTLSTSEARTRFSVYGDYDKDDFVTLLLGKDGSAVEVIDGDAIKYAASNDDDVTFAEIVKSTMKGPVIAKDAESWKYEIPFDVTAASFYKKNSEAKISDVAKNDVLYYSKSLATVWVYSDRATGTIEAINPNRIAPDSVTISGKTYALESTNAAYSVSSMGTFTLGDTVTLLLGKSGGAVEVLSGTEGASDVYGFITAMGDKTYTRSNGVTYSAESITVIASDTQTYTYEYDNSGFKKGDFVRIVFTDGGVSISKSKLSVSSDEADKINTLLSTGMVEDSAELLDIFVTTDANSLTDKSVAYTKIYPARLAGVSLTKDNIYYYSIENGKLKNLILNDFTGDIHTYGVLITERENGNVVYKLLANGKKQNASSSAVMPSVGPVRLKTRGSSSVYSNLDYVVVKPEDLHDAFCSSSGTSYPFAPNMECYTLNTLRQYEASTLTDIAAIEKCEIRAYYDKLPSMGGRVRVLVAALK